MEHSFGRDFGHVRVHSDELAQRSASALHADAYTAGEHVVFARDRYRPERASGRRLIAHELAHVVQQEGRVPSGGSAAGMLEQEAARASAGGHRLRGTDPKRVAASTGSARCCPSRAG
jgi:hypothetical protein